MIQFLPHTVVPRSWKKFLGGLTAAMLLAPIPAYAVVLTLGTGTPWTSIYIYNTSGNNPQSMATGWTVTNDTAAGVSIQATSGSASASPGDTYIDVYASIDKGSQINSVATHNFNSLTVAGKVTISVQGFTNLNIAGPFTNLSPNYSSNQFSNQQLPPSTALFGTPGGSANISAFTYIHIRFDFTPGSSWTATPSSPVTVIFTGS